MQTLTYLYLLVLLTTTAKSVLMLRNYSLKLQNYLAVYLISTCIVEFYALTKKIFFNNLENGIDFNIYLTFCIYFFIFFYWKKLNPELKKFLLLGSIFSLFYILFFTSPFDGEFEIGIGMATALFYIFGSLLWFYSKINSKDLGKITDDPVFWISTGLLLWSCFFLFRIIPMFLFESIDKKFLTFMKSILQVINIITYALIFVALVKSKKITNRILE